MPDDPDRASRPAADGDWHETELARLRQERDALRAWLAGQEPVPHGDLSPAVLRRKRQWCQVQRWRAAQQRRRGED
jgi:hypothetical protein